MTVNAKDRHGFTLVEVLLVVVIMAILASVVVPQFSSSSEDAKDASLMHNLQILRKQIELFKAQHNGNAPGWTGMPGRVHLILATDAQGVWKSSDVFVPDANHPFGPYLRTSPINPFNNGFEMKTSGDPANETPDESLLDGGNLVGWFYDPDTGRIAPNAEGSTADGIPRVEL